MIRVEHFLASIRVLNVTSEPRRGNDLILVVSRLLYHYKASHSGQDP